MFFAKFQPKEDITAYELAILVSNFGGSSPPKHGLEFRKQDWDELGNLQRHFVIVRKD